MIEYENLNKLNKSFLEDYKKSFQNTLASGWYILGNNVTSFEKSFSKYIGVSYGIGVASGLDAMVLSLKALSLNHGDEVIVPSNTYIATIIAIIQAGLSPVLVEPDPKTYNIDPSKIEQNLSKKTRAILVVHLYGKACEMDPIINLCNQYNLRLLEDCAQSHGAMYKGKKTGSFGDFGCFSFYPTKNLGALGDAGAILCNDEKLANKVRQLRNYGSKKKYYNDVIGYNSRLDEVQAGFLNIKLKALDDINKHKRKLADLYFKNLKGCLVKPAVSKDYFDVYHIFTIRHKDRDKLKNYLLKYKIQTEIHYPIAPHKQKAMNGIFANKYPISEEIHSTTLSLPISYFHSKKDVLKVCEVVNKYFSK